MKTAITSVSNFVANNLRILGVAAMFACFKWGGQMWPFQCFAIFAVIRGYALWRAGWGLFSAPTHYTKLDSHIDKVENRWNR